MVEERIEEGQKVSALGRVKEFCREDPISVGLLVAFTITGAVGAFLIPLGDLSVTRRVIGGAVAGLYFGIFPLGFRLFR